MKKKALSLVLILTLCLGLLPMSALAAETVASGKCGINLTWNLTSDGILTIGGTGEMWDWGNGNHSPWDHDERIERVVMESGVTSIGQSAFSYCLNLTDITIPNSVSLIGDAAFYFCNSLTSITIPDSVAEIGRSAFLHCTSLTSVTIPDGVTAIRDDTFLACKNLISVTIPDSVTLIRDDAFNGCNSLTSVTIPNNVTYIGEMAFRYCRSMISVTIPDSVAAIGHTAFSGCDSLKNVYYSGTREQWNAIRIGPNNDPLFNATIHSIGAVQPAAKDFTYNPPQNLTYDGSSKTATVRAAVTSSIHSGYFTLAFTDEQNNSVTDLVKPGTYRVLAKVSAHGNYASGEVSLGSVTITETAGLHGKISLSFGDKQSSSGVAYVPGDVVVTIHAAPDPGYQLSVIRVVRNDNGQQVPLSGSGNARTFRMPPADVSIQAEFSVR